jgi:hypothetical protein
MEVGRFIFFPLVWTKSKRSDFLGIPMCEDGAKTGTRGESADTRRKNFGVKNLVFLEKYAFFHLVEM